MEQDDLEAMRELGLQIMSMRYRLDLTEQLVLRLVAVLAKTQPGESAAIADQVRHRAEMWMAKRQNPHEMEAQESMLELLNNVIEAAKPRG